MFTLKIVEYFMHKSMHFEADTEQIIFGHANFNFSMRPKNFSRF